MTMLRVRDLIVQAHERLGPVADSRGARARLLDAIRLIDDQRLTNRAAERYQARLREDSDRIRGTK